MTGTDPYRVLGVSPMADDAELRATYRRAVQRHHPDHNGGSPESARRFEAIQEAYAAIRAQRAAGGPRNGAQAPRSPSGGAPGDPGVDGRLAAMEAELAAAREAEEHARREAREAAQAAARAVHPGRPSDEELGYVTTDDSFGAILADAAAGLSEQLDQARPRRDAGDVREAVTDRVADVLEDLGARLRGERPQRGKR